VPHLSSTFAVLRPDQSAALVDVSPAVYEELDRRFDGFRGHTLVSSYRFESDWASWEMHPAAPAKMLFVTPGQGTQHKPA
jgi:hypothetical protein